MSNKYIVILIIILYGPRLQKSCCNFYHNIFSMYKKTVVNRHTIKYKSNQE